MSRRFATPVAGVVFVLGFVALSRTASPQPQGIPALPTIPGVQRPQLPSRDNSAAKAGTATIRGRVLAAENGQPLRKAQIRLVSSAAPGGQFPDSRLATTDADGKYEFTELPAGRYTLSAQKGSYVALQYGQRRAFEPGKPLELADGQTIERVDFSLPRGGVITGRILDEFGEPVADVQVSPMRYQFSVTATGSGRRLVVTNRPASTNDIGEFRLFGLAPGDYYMSATLREVTLGTSSDRSGYAPTYYPGTADPTAAHRIAVGIGQTVSDIVLPLLPIRTARVSGTAVDTQGRPLQGLVIALARSGPFGMPFLVSPTPLRPDGSFSVSGLTPGDYTLQVQPIGPADVNADFASLELTVEGNDITGVRLAATKTSNVSGRIVFAGLSGGASLPTSGLRVMVAILPGVVFGPTGTSGAPNEDGTFQLKVRPGSPRLTVTGLPQGWALKAVRHRGVDVTDSGIEVRPTEDVADIEVELTNRITDVTGLVTNSRGEPVTDYSAILFSRDPEKWRPPSRYVRSGRPDQDGRFKLSGMPPGEYLAIAVDSVDPSEMMDPEFLDRVQNRATRVSVGEGETKSLELKLITLP